MAESMYCYHQDQPIFSVNVRRLGMLVHQQNACECQVYDLLRNLTALFPPCKYSITFKHVKQPVLSESLDAWSGENVGQGLNIKNVLSNNQACIYPDDES